MHKYLGLSVVIFLFMLFASCANEVEIYDDEYTEVTVVYGLLSQAETDHYLKITKAYQTEGNILLAAKENDISQYDADDLEVWVDVYNQNNVFINTHYFDTVLITNKDTGTFYAPEQIVYNLEDIELNQNHTYKLFVKIKESGKLIDSETQLVKDFSIKTPNLGIQTYGFTGIYPTTIDWVSADNGLLYDVSFRFYYTELNSANESSSHYVDWYLGRKRAINDEGGDIVGLEYIPDGFFDFIQNTIPDIEQGSIRYADSLDLIFNVADEVLTTYMDINEPSNSIVQDKPQFTNITNGVGIFSSRYRKVRRFDALANRTLDSLYNSYRTTNLGFVSRPF